MNKKNSFLMYKDYLPQFELLTDEQAGQLIKVILIYVNGLELPEMSSEVRVAFSFIKAALKRDLMKYESIVTRNIENGKTGGRPRKDENPKNPVGYSENPKKPKKADSDSVSVSVNGSGSGSEVQKNKPMGEILENMILEYTSNPDLIKALREFVQHRNSKAKDKLTAMAMTKNLNLLTQYFDNDDDRIKSIDQTIANNWKGIFPVDKASNKVKKSPIEMLEEGDWIL
jgi:hypothetical protein